MQYSVHCHNSKNSQNIKFVRKQKKWSVCDDFNPLKDQYVSQHNVVSIWQKSAEQFRNQKSPTYAYNFKTIKIILISYEGEFFSKYILLTFFNSFQPNNKST